MDLLDLPAIIPSAGVLGLLAWLLIRLTIQSSGDRSDYQKRIIEVRQHHSVEIQELTARHDAQIDELRADIVALRAEVSDLRGQIEAERKARFEAEDQAARFRRQLAVEDADEIT